MVRALLAEAWDHVEESRRPTQRELVEHMEEFRDRWMHEPCEGSISLMTPAELIESERRRMPISSDGHPHLDDDCPLCQAMANGEFGPSFMWFDGHHLELEDEFAFSLCRTREEWDKQQEDYRKFAEEMDRKEQERAAHGEDEADSAWKRSYVNWDAMAGPGASAQQGMLALGVLLAELVTDLQPRPGGAELVRALNDAYAAARESGTNWVANDAAGEQFREVLEGVCEKHPDLTAKCADLQSRVDEVLRLPF
jgi:hypothetical protein